MRELDSKALIDDMPRRLLRHHHQEQLGQRSHFSFNEGRHIPN
jgi:hypothetical protein